MHDLQQLQLRVHAYRFVANDARAVTAGIVANIEFVVRTFVVVECSTFCVVHRMLCDSVRSNDVITNHCKPRSHETKREGGREGGREGESTDEVGGAPLPACNSDITYLGSWFLQTTCQTRRSLLQDFRSPRSCIFRTVQSGILFEPVVLEQT